MKKLMFSLVFIPVLLKAMPLLIEIDPVMTAQGFSGITLFESTVSTYGNPALLAAKRTSVTYINEQCKIPVDYIYSLVSPIPRQPQWLSGLANDMRLYYYEYTIRPLSKRLWKFSSPTLSFYRFKGTYGRVSDYTSDGKYIEWSPYDEIKAVGIGTDIDSTLFAGIRAKYYDSYLIPQDLLEDAFGLKGGRAKGFLFDFGLIANTKMGLRYGVSLLNLGGPIKYSPEDNGDSPPTFIRQEVSFNSYDFINFIRNITGIYRLSMLNTLGGFTYSTAIWTDMVGDLHEIWKGKGYEVNILNLFFIRKGYFNDTVGSRIGETSGFGFKLGNIVYNFANDSAIYSFTQPKNWRVSLTLTDNTTSLKLIKKLIGRNNTVKLMGILAPGGGHLIIGEKYKGIFFFGLTNLFLKAAEKETDIMKIAFLLTGAGVYAYSIIDLNKILRTM